MGKSTTEALRAQRGRAAEPAKGENSTRHNARSSSILHRMAKKAIRKTSKQSPSKKTSKKTAGKANSPSAKKPLNRSLRAARTAKQDEFYTQLPDIEKELKHYIQPDGGHFAGKTVLCNCDDPKVSAFFTYFSRKFHDLGLKRLITTCYQNADPDLFSTHEGKRGLRLIYDGERTPGGRIPALSKLDTLELKSDGDFRSEECAALLEEADIVVTNPPFSLFREYVGQLMDYDKKFLIIGNMHAIKYKGFFELIQDDKVWLGNAHPKAFVVPDHYEMRKVRSWRDENGTNWRSLGNACWFTNLDIAKRHEELVLYKNYSRQANPKYANFDAVEVGRYADIPSDYDGAMGVPLSLLDHYNPEQFEIIGTNRTVGVTPMSEIAKKGTYTAGGPCFYLANGDGTYRRMYERLVIRRKKK